MVRAVVLAASASLLLLAAPVHATDAQGDLDAAVKLYEELEYEQAVLRLQRAARTPGLSDVDRGRIHVLLGLCYLQQLDQGGAEVQFDAALRADETAALPPYAPPAAAELFAAVKVRSRSAAPDAPPPPPPPPVEPQHELLAWQVPTTGALLAAGAAAALGGAVTLVFAGANAAVATDPQALQLEARAAAAAANFELVVGGGTLALGAALLGGGAALLALDGAEQK